MTKAKRLILGLAVAVLSIVLTVLSVLAFDLYLHKRHEKTFGLNIWGYRGPVVKRKQPREKRIVVLGGSTAFGYGVNPESSIPAFLEQKLNAWRRQEGHGPVSVVNLAFNNQGAYSFLFTLQDYAYLNYDGAIFYEGYNDLGSPNKFLFRRDSPIFRITGYYPIFPLILSEKAMAIRYGGNVEAAYRREKTFFRPTLADRTRASALEAGVQISQALERQLGRLTEQPAAPLLPGDLECAEPWLHYCQSIYAATDYLLKQGKRVILVTQPYASDRHVDQQRALTGMIKHGFGNDPRLRYVNLGSAIDLKDRTIAYDGLHLTAQGNERIAEGLLQDALDMLK